MNKNLVSIRDTSTEDIELIINTALSFKEVLGRDIKKVPTLRGKTAVNLFFEPSTRTKTSFELAQKRLSTDVVNFTVPTSSVVKGESLFDTIRTIEAYGVDFIIIRHQCSGVPYMVSRFARASIINAGDGINEHPTQALLDAFTIIEKKGAIAGLKIAIVGDIFHSRVAKSNIYCLTRLGAQVRLIAPTTFLPKGIESQGVDICNDLNTGLKGVDVVMVLRIQKERQGSGFFSTAQEYFRFWGVTHKALAAATPDAIVMHPGPMNRGVEIASDVADSAHSVIYDQVLNGLAIRMAVLYLLSGARP
ncbi:MAG: aspartate carbamoyltransferase catalytic subunit [Nitrospirae bacterium]|uniref:aspartate carbamoyltransferase catalytic subunit n=1 Tax=Candidatus Magnetobacterium casense TaxID=1455061 RepID=UPI00058F9DFD|nr:aspartate carbamoyltransferase catalytic subunit [Candidatus Magnetobacterium casensis]MBF0336824.1 aspartate carbamoyltransferase catalytic subunit [Nitrospirota bacterium]